MRIENRSKLPMVINVGVDDSGKPKDIHLRARGFKGSVSRELTTDEINSPEVQKLLTRKTKIRLLG